MVIGSLKNMVILTTEEINMVIMCDLKKICTKLTKVGESEESAKRAIVAVVAELWPEYLKEELRHG